MRYTVSPSNLWDYHARGHWVCVPTNGVVKPPGNTLVMGAGVALQAARRFSTLPRTMGNFVSLHGNVVGVFPYERIISFPTKQHWAEPSSLTLIRDGAASLARHTGVLVDLDKLAGMEWKSVCLPKLGCGCGGLNWEKQVEPVLSEYLDDNYLVV